ncbi:MAG: glycosyltransferase family 4 protein [Opitutaceae bacterium]|nr:glycosyltransferase family 4 protein [Opitutaceae bacterium]
MKIVLLSPELFRAEGGIARIMRLYLKALCELCGPGGRVNSLALNDRDEPPTGLSRYSNGRLVAHRGADRRKSRFVWHAIRLARDADWVVCGHIGQLVAAKLARIGNPSLRYALVAHGIEVWRPFTGLERWSLRGAERILCISEYTRRQLLRFCPGLDPARLVVVPNTLDPQLAQNLRASSAATPIILSVGRLVRADAYKGFDTLIEAMPAVTRNAPAVQLRIVGTGDDLPRLQALARQLGVENKVTFLGALPDEQLAEEYAGCSVFALPSRREGFGLVYLEAMIRGKACIGARAGGTPEVITGQTGILVEYGNVPELAAAVTDLLRQPNDSEIVRRHAETFAFPHFVNRLAQALRN